MEYEISEILYYPVKSLGAVSVPEITLDQFGIKNDRRFMLIDQNAKFVSQRECPKLSLLFASLESGGVSVCGAGLSDLFFSYESFIHDIDVQIWSDTVSVKCADSCYTDELSDWLGFSVQMVYMPETAKRQVDRVYVKRDQNVSFADAFPLLLANTASLNELNGRLDHAVPMSRFRPNIVVTGNIAFQEDEWRHVIIGGVGFDIVKPCSRCGMTTIDENGVIGKEPLKTLASYRKNDFGVCFGQNMVHRSSGRIQVGDLLIVR